MNNFEIILGILLAIFPLILLLYILFKRWTGEITNKKALLSYNFIGVIITFEIIIIATSLNYELVDGCVKSYKFGGGACTLRGFPIKFLTDKGGFDMNINYIKLIFNCIFIFIFLITIINLIDKVISNGKSTKN